MKLIITFLISTILFITVASFSLKKSNIAQPEMQKTIEQKLRSFFKNDNINVNVQFDSDEPEFSVSTTPKWTYPLPLKSIRILTTSGNIKIVTSLEATQKNEVIVKTLTPKSNSLDIEMNDSDLIIGSSAQIINQSHDLRIEIPEHFDSEINIKTISGDVEANSLNLKNFILNSVSGDVSFKNFKSAQTQIQTVSGDVELGLKQTADSKYQFKIETVSGKISNQIQSANAAENSIVIQTTSGDITINKSKN